MDCVYLYRSGTIYNTYVKNNSMQGGFQLMKTKINKTSEGLKDKYHNAYTICFLQLSGGKFAT